MSPLWTTVVTFFAVYGAVSLVIDIVTNIIMTNEMRVLIEKTRGILKEAEDNHDESVKCMDKAIETFHKAEKELARAKQLKDDFEATLKPANPAEPVEEKPAPKKKILRHKA